jgi:hypothetical protein
MNPLLVQEAAAALLSSAGRSGLKNLFSMVVAGILIFAGLGYYLDWYKIRETPGPNGQQNITIGVNTNEIKKDFAIVRDRAGQIINGKPAGYPAPTQPGYPSNYPQQNPYQPTQYPAQYQQPYQQPYAQQPTQYAPGYAQQPAYTQQQQPGYYPPAGTYPPQQGGWTPSQPASRPAYPPGTRPF